MLDRRTFLGLPLLGLFAPSLAQAKSTSRVVDVSKGARGTTITLEIDNAPFPAPGAGYRDSTVMLFIPRFFRADGGVQTVVHFHGYKTTAASAMERHQLREQLFDSKQNAVLVVPQLAFKAADISAGKLQKPGGFGRMLRDTLQTAASSAQVRKVTGDASLPTRPRVGTVCVSAHSGGYHAASNALKHGGVDVSEAWLFDALYADVEVFKSWVLARRSKALNRRHKIVSYYTAGVTERNTRTLFAALEKQGVSSALETVEGTLSRQDITRAQAVAIKTRSNHGAVAAQYNGLRDCLFASTLQRSIRANWFDSKKGARKLDERVR